MYGKFKSKKYVKKRGIKSKTSRRRGKSTFIVKKAREIGKYEKRVQRGVEIFPRTWFVQFKYAESSYIAPVAAAGLSALGYVYSTNNSFDPRYSTGGNQPLWYDEVVPYYERIWDHAVKVELTFSNPTIDGLYVGYRVRSQTNAVTTVNKSLDYLQQMDLTEMKPINNSGSQVVKFSFFIKNHKLFGITKSQFGDLTYSHQNIGDPSVYGWIEPWAISTTSDASVRYDIKIIYYSELTNRVTPNEST